MIPIDLSEARKAFHDKTINMWELTFLEGVHKQDKLSEKQCDKIIAIAEKMVPLRLIIPEVRYRAPIDPYFESKYYTDDY